MTEGHRPDDLGQWPDDPYLLLGVDRSVDSLGLRRAYLRLIRHYRPEHFPEQFRRIRAAYERLQHSLQPRRPRSGGAEKPPAAGSKPPSPTPPKPPAVASRPPTPADSPVEAAWNLAREGQLAEAYRRLQELERQHPGSEKLCLRLYWLLVLHPGLDPDRDRRCWLVAGLSAREPSGPLWDLYDRELAGDPAEARHARCRGLLEPSAPIGQRLAFALHCWRYLGVAGGWDLILEDLNTFRQHLATSHSTDWVRMLLACKNQLRWQSNPEVCGPQADACQREIDQYSEEHQRLASELDQGDYIDMLTHQLRTLVPSERLPLATVRQLRELLRRGWGQSIGMIQDDFLAFLRPMVEDPLRALDQLDGIYQTSPLVLHQLHLQVQSLYSHRSGLRAQVQQIKEHPQVVSEFFAEQRPAVYTALRRGILLVCLRRRMTFAQFQQAASGLALSSDLRERWTKELPLHCLTAACQAFWAAG